MIRKLGAILLAAIFLGMFNRGLSKAEEESGYEKLSYNALDKYTTIFSNGCDALLEEPLDDRLYELAMEIVEQICTPASDTLAKLRDRAAKRDFVVEREALRNFQWMVNELSKEFAQTRIQMTKCAESKEDCWQAVEDLKSLRATAYAFNANTLKEFQQAVKRAKKEKSSEKSKKEQKRAPKINPYVE